MDDLVSAPKGGRQAVIATITHPRSGSYVGTNVTLWGTATPGGQVEILDGTEPLTFAEVDDLGFWGASLRDLSAGTHQLQARADGQISVPVRIVVEDGQVPVPVRPVAEDTSPAGKPRKTRLLLLAAGIVIAAAVIALVVTRANVHLRSTPSSSGQARIVTPSPVAPTVVSAPVPARSWSFTALTGTVDQAILALNNPGTSRAIVAVVVSGSRQDVTLQPQSEAEMELGKQARTGSIGITSTAPIIAERIVVKHGKTTTSYGLRG
jgi:hypothetical protein